MACKFVPEPDASTAKREPSGSLSGKPGPRSLRDLPDPPCLATRPAQRFEPGLRLSRRHHRAEADAKVEHLTHLFLGYLAKRTYEPENRGLLPGTRIELRPEPPKSARQVPHESSARNVRHSPDLDRLSQCLYLPHVGPVRFQVDLADGTVQAFRLVRVGNAGVGEHLAGQRVAVGVKSTRRQANYGVAGLHPLAAYYLAPLARSDADADDLEVALAIKSRHLRCFAADERHTEWPAGFCCAADYPGDGLGVEPAAPYVVQKQQWASSGGEHVVGAVVDDIRAESIVAPDFAGDEDLRADAVDGRREDGVVVAGEGVEPSEATCCAKHFRAVGSLHGRAHEACGLISTFDRDARGLVGAFLSEGPHYGRRCNRTVPRRRVPPGCSRS